MIRLGKSIKAKKSPSSSELRAQPSAEMMCPPNAKLPAPPDPTFEVCQLLAYMKKRGLIVELRKCKIKWKQLGHDPYQLDDIIKSHVPERIRIGKDFRGKDVVQVYDRAWADNWACYYNTELPHHGQQMRPGRVGANDSTKKLHKKR